MKTITFKNILLLLTFSFVLALNSSAQTNIAGVVNTYKTVSAISGVNITLGDATGLAIDDPVMIIQMTGISGGGNTGGTDNGAGNFHIATITGVFGSGITIDKPVVKTFTPSTEKVQLVRIARYTNDVNVLGNVTAQPWDGSTGGVIFIDACQNNITLNADISASGAGFFGRNTNGNETSTFCGQALSFLNTPEENWGTNPAYYGNNYPNFVANSGGTGRGGHGGCDDTQGSPDGGAGVGGDGANSTSAILSSGGGGGGYGGGGTGGGNGTSVGGFDATATANIFDTANNLRFFMGATGGSEAEWAPATGNGGGIVIILADNITTGGANRDILSDGDAGPNTGTFTYGSFGSRVTGGAGGAGYIAIKANIINSTVRAYARGGTATVQTAPASPTFIEYGGPGGGGFIISTVPITTKLVTKGAITAGNGAKAAADGKIVVDSNIGTVLSLLCAGDACDAVATGNPDRDNDGISDTCDLDNDNDGILDTIESGGFDPYGDEDGDGTLNYLDNSDLTPVDGDQGLTNYTDSNGDGIPDVYDADGDGVPNHLDLDSDNDGLADVIESGGQDINRDGLADGASGPTGVPSSSGAGITPASSDGDTLPNYLDIDSDNDGIPDNIEGQPTSGYIPPSLQNGGIFIDSNGNGVDDAFEFSGIIGFTPTNTDGTDNPDYLDADSDNDGIADIVENGDTDNAIVDVNADADGDGLNDIFDDTDDSAIQGATVNDGINPPSNLNLGDDDNDFSLGGDVDYRDNPSITDTDNDGIPDSIDIDDDNDGILDTEEGCTPATGTFTENLSFTTVSGSGFTYSSNNITYNNPAFGLGSDNFVNSTHSPNFSTYGVTGDFELDFTLDGTYTNNNDRDVYIGINEAGTEASIGTADVDYAFRIRASGTGIRVYENGTDRGSLGITGTSGNILTIRKVSAQITYLVNGTLEYTSTVDANGSDYYVDNSFYGQSDEFDLNTFNVEFSTVIDDLDGDGISNCRDLDTDNDGIPDNIEAQSTIGYITPSGTDSDNDGLDDAYDSTPNGNSDGTGSLGLIPQNTDGTDNADYKDLDSDNDGLFDVAESGSGLAHTGGVVDGAPAAFGTNGLINSLDNGDNYTDPNGSFDETQTDNFTDSDGDIGTGGDVDYRDIFGVVDTDNDGIADADDLDDDNDGILDLIENGNCDVSSKEEIAVLYSEDFGTGTDNRTTNANVVNHLYDTAGSIPDGSYAVVSSLDSGLQYYNRTDTNGDKDANIDQFSDPNVGGSSNGRYLAINMINTAPTEFFRQSLSNLIIGADYRYRLDMAGLCDGCPDKPEFLLEIQPSGGGTALQTISSTTLAPVVGNDDNWRRVVLNFTATTNSIDIVIINEQPAGGQGNDVGIDNIVFGVLQCPSSVIDPDGDGIINSLDLDSDNDGIPDVIESGGTDANRDGRADDPVGTAPTTNGIPSSAGTGNTPTDTDGSVTEDLPDFLDIDADNDGIPDNIEGQTTSGWVAPSGIGSGVGGITDLNNNGVDDNYETGALVGLDPTNTDNADNPDYKDTDSDNDGITDINENGDGNTLANTDLDGDGLDDNFDDTDDSATNGSTVNDNHNPPAPGNLGDDDNDFSNGGNVDYRDVPGTDTDNDGILDVNDLDDDNDGILDVDEGHTPESTTCTTVNTPVAGVGGSNVQSGHAIAPFTEINDGVAIDNEGLAMNNLAHYAVIDLGSLRESSSTVRFNWWQNVSANVNQQTITQVATSTTNTPGTNPLVINYQGFGTSGSFIYTLNAPTQYLLIDMTVRNSSRIEITEVTVESNCVTTETTTDSDGDGIPNHLDIDSDNDGIPDVIESGGTDADRDGRADGTVGTSGNTLGVPSSTTGGTGNTPTNSDFDTIPDYLDIDADNDGIPDNIEGQPSKTYVAPSGVGSGVGGITDDNNNGLDDNYETGGFVGINPENTDGTDNPDYTDLDSDNDFIDDISENGNVNNVTSGVDTDGDGLDDNFDDNDDSGIAGATVNDNHNPPAPGNLGDVDNDFNSIGDLDYRDTGANGLPIITQVYQFGDEKWIEITNISTTASVNPNLINIQLYKDKTGDQTGEVPNALYTVVTTLAPGKSVLFKNSANLITNLGANATVVVDDNLTEISGGNDIITLSSKINSNSYKFRYDEITSVTDKTSFVRIDETLTGNKNYTPSEWVVFVDDALDPYRLLGAGGTERHPHDPLISEIISSNTDANTMLGLHRVDITTRTGSAWSNGFPDRSRFVVIDEDYDHSTARLSARKLEIDNNSKLVVTNNLLVVTNDVNLTNANDEIRLVGTSQLVQTHTDATKVSGLGKLLVDQNSTVPSFYRYNYMSSPVTSNGTTYSLETVFKDGTTPLAASNTIQDITFVGGYDGNHNTNPISLASYWIYTYSPSTDGRSNWAQRSETGTIAAGDGFIFKGPGVAQNYTFTGIPNDGNLDASNIGAGQSYLVGNPFSSAISVKKFIEDNDSSLTGTLYFWQHASEVNSQAGTSTGHNFAGYIGGYATRTIDLGVAANAYTVNQSNGTSGTGTGHTYDAPGLYIPIGQGFFIEGDATGGAVVFNNSQREFIDEAAGVSVFFKGEETASKNTGNYENTVPIIKLGMDYLNEQAISIHRQIGISFNPNNTFEYEKGYDAGIYDISTTDFYWKFPTDDTKYVISGIQDITSDLEVPLEITMGYSGEVSITVDEIKNVSENVYIIDKTTGIFYEIINTKAVLNLNEGVYTDRFVLGFKPNTALSTDDIIDNAYTNVYADNKNHTLVISKNLEVDITNVELYNILGEKVSLWKIKKQNNSYKLDIKKQIPTGIYIVRLNTSKGEINKKIVIE
ncbi:T9SS type A sorting domain-containing protein [Polaribacter sp. SA4-12]|uniref:T9SS type A sorting domain-containing protein n=1 Tax=Polaribacter sp. SA4-12 TaxID=1312072 RepID=UPI000B3C5440|nr:T9SS type A sorting domain-containing protein [Polaribacter sp. SA4-12]ARV14523.1 hypothetical protein BTO07_04870 [Polaribacter sp. SA4-12]